MNTPKERPIIMQAESVRAILEGRKSQTRRVMSEPWKIRLPLTVRGDWPFQGTWAAPGIYEAHHNQYGAVSVKATSNEKMLGIKPAEFEWVCPYGVPGDRLWVKEPWRALGWDEDFTGVAVQYRDGTRQWCDFPEPVYSQSDDHWTEWLIKETERIAALPGVSYNRETELYQWDSDDVIPWKTPLFMPRWASRITLENVSVKVERLFDISQEDAKAEGVSIEATRTLTYRGAFAITWDAINKKRGWGWEGGSNPWVWAISFRRINANS